MTVDDLGILVEDVGGRITQSSSHSSVYSTAPLHPETSMTNDVQRAVGNVEAEDGSVSNVSDVMMETPMITPFVSPSSASMRSIGRQCRVRFIDKVTVREIPNRERFNMDSKRKMWWTKNEEAVIEREVYSIAKMIDLNCLPSSKCSYGHVRGAVFYTNKANLNRSLQRDRLCHEIAGVQRAHRDDQNVGPLELAATQSLKPMLIANVCENISQVCTRNALEIARLDAEQAEQIYQEEFGDLFDLSLGDLTDPIDDSPEHAHEG